MPFLGSTPAEQYKSLAKQTITGDGSTSYTLNRSVTNEFDIEVFINNVRQEPTTSYSASGNTITFTAAVTASDSCYLIYQGRSVGTVNPPTNSVGETQIQNGSVTHSKFHTNALDPIKLSGNNVGIGTSSPANFGGSTLQVNHASSYSSVLATSGSYSMQFMASQTNGVTNMGSRSNHPVSITTNDTPRLTIDTSGRVTTPYQPRFLVVPSGNANVTYGSQKHTYTATAYNVGSHYDTSNGRFTAPIGGFYWFEHRMAMSGGNQATLEAKVYVNGSEFARSYLDYDGSTGTDRVQTIIQMSAGDYAEAYTHWSSTSLNNYLAQGGGNTQNAITCFMGALVG